jgi:hypothetical protein
MLTKALEADTEIVDFLATLEYMEKEFIIGDFLTTLEYMEKELRKNNQVELADICKQKIAKYT